jgi:hypothetical protein
MSVIENNNIMHIVITIDIVERSPTPIVIYSVEGELDYLAIKYDNRQNLDDTRKLNNGMMQTRGGDGERGHLLYEALSIFAQEDFYMIHLLSQQKYIDIVKAIVTGWVERVNFLLLFSYLS